MARLKIKNESQNGKITSDDIIKAIPADLSNLWVLLMFSLFPLVYHNRYFDILETKTKWFYYLAAGLVLMTVLWLALNCSPKEYFKSAASSYRGGNGKWFGNWFLNTFNMTDRFVLIYLAVNVISTLLAYPYSYQAFWGDEGRLTGLHLNLAYCAVYFIVSRFYRFKKIHYTVFLIASAIVCALAVLQNWGFDVLGFRVGMRADQYGVFTSTLGNINIFGSFISMAVGVSAALFILNEERIWHSVIYYLCMTVIFAGVVAAMSDNAFLAVGLAFGFLPLIAFRKTSGIRRYVVSVATFFTVIKVIYLGSRHFPDSNWIRGLLGILGDNKYMTYAAAALWIIAAVLYIAGRKETPGRLAHKAWVRVWIGVIAAVVISVITVLLAFNCGWLDVNVADSSYHKFAEFLRFDDNWGTYRGYIWRATLEEYAKFPFFRLIFGNGPDTFGIYMKLNRYEDMVRHTSLVYDSVHNEYLQYLFTIGAAGLISWLGILICGAKDLIRKASGVKTCYMIAIAFAFMCYSVTAITSISESEACGVLWAFIAIGQSLIRDTQR